jgi:hypothetical protein
VKGSTCNIQLITVAKLVHITKILPVLT